jgi:CheY-like chemotaxis protein/signal transduction histidine kinase/CHASE3 domain sensor protein
MTTSSIDEQSFRKILRRNVTIPVLLGIFSAFLFGALITYLLDQIDWVEHTDRVINTAHETQKLAVDMESSVRGYLLSGDDRYLDIYELARARVPAGIKMLQALVSDNITQVDRLGRVSVLQAAWAERAQRIIEIRRGNGDFESVMRLGKGKQLADEMRSEFSDLIAMEQSLRIQRTEAVQRTTVVTVSTFVLFTLLASLVTGYFGRRELMRLSDSYNSIVESQHRGNVRLEHAAWLKEGQTLLASRVIGELSMNSLGRNTLQFLADYLGAVVAAFYVRQTHGGLVRVASYGFSRQQELAEQSFSPGEGLIGQAVEHYRVVTLDDVPPGYFKVSSGLGDGLPSSVIIAPVANDGKVNGVVELGFLRSLTTKDAEFLNVIGNDIGVSIEAARYRQQIQEILAETQQLNEELQVQQEELRTTNEELEEQSRVLRDSQASLEIQQVELKQTNQQLVDQSLELARQRDKLDRNNEDLKSAQEELEARALELQRASKYKSEFLANMSHELRTPLNSSLILSKLLADNASENLTEEQVKFADSIYSAGTDLLHLINDILDIAKVEAGKFELFPDNLSIAKLLNGLKNTFEPLALQKGLTLSLEIQEGAPSSINADQQRLEQILKNLLANAIKFTDVGIVQLVVSPDADSGVVFSIVDSGIGIAADLQEKIFEAFHQGDGSTSRRYGGTGLGLSISQQLAVLLGGQISVTSSLGQGSTFKLTVPVAYRAALEKSVELTSSITTLPALLPESKAESMERQTQLPRFDDDRHEVPFTKRVILVIEDDERFAHVLYDLAHERGYQCLVAHGADEGLELASQFIPDALLLDIRLPDFSGLSVLQKLKDLSATRHIPVHVISVEDRQEAAMHLGAVGYAVKPTTLEALKEVFGKIEAKLTQKVKHVLLVEDDARQRDSVVRLISDDDVEITAVEMGHEALSLLRMQTFDCMIIDLKLPDMSGNELLQAMASEDIASFPPVIIYTGRNLTRDEEAELLRYSRTIIIKGARSPERLLDEVTLFLHKIEKNLSREKQQMLKVARSRDRVFEGRTILVVDDDVRNIFALTSALEHKGAFVQVARNGLEALQKLNAVKDIDIVLMDIMMPEMDGYEAIRQIRDNQEWRKLPIIAVTAKAMKDDQEHCLSAGANDYLAKPIELERLFSLIRVWMPKLEHV